MFTKDCIMALFVRVDTVLGHLSKSKHPHAVLHRSEIVTLVLLIARKGVDPCAFYC